MGWLFGCFGYQNKKKRLKPFHINRSKKKGMGSYQTLESLLLSELPKGGSSKGVHSNLKRRKHSGKDQGKPRIRKKVRFDLNVIAYEPAPIYHDDDEEDDDDLRCILEANSEEEEEEEEEDIADFLECARNSVGMKRERSSDSSYRYGNCYDQEEEDELDSEDEIETDEELETIHESHEGDASNSCCVNPVLIPIENLTQWRAIKTKRWEIVA